MTELEKTSIEIEKRRKWLYSILSKNKDIINQDAVIISQELDRLITRYYKIYNMQGAGA